ncbi:MAG TPA: PLP-dependent aminotransferase family protein, partial [Thermomicrobiales bacterium]|nr:PLP-dependent aminotransferase family protein [Thermomicrobiales bacterium]
MSADTGVAELLSQRGINVGESRGNPPVREDVISFSGGFPDPARFPYTEIAEAASRTMQSHGQWPLQYGPAMGYEGMLDFLVEKLGKHQDIRCGRENLILTAGGSQALALLCDLFVDQGDTIISEAPTWMGAGRIFGNVGARVESVPLDAEGTRVDALEERLKDLKARGVTPKCFYIIPNFQNPSGVTTTLARRQRIVELAAEYNFAILEDDAYFDLRFAGEKLP